MRSPALGFTRMVDRVASFRCHTVGNIRPSPADFGCSNAVIMLVQVNNGKNG